MDFGEIKSYDNVFFNIDKKIDSLPLTKSEMNRAHMTVENYSDIAKNLASIAREGNDELRNKLINKITKGGAEEGFCAGKNSKEALNVLSERIELFIKTWEKSLNKEKEVDFFKCFSKGDPCLSGRTESLINFAAEMEGFNIKEMPDPEKALYLPGTALSDLFFNYVDEIEDAEGNCDSINSSGFAEYLLKPVNKQKMVEEMDRHLVNTSAVADFKEFLVFRGLVTEDQEIKSWDNIMEKLLDSKDPTIFSPIFNQIKNQNEGLY